MSVAAMKRAFVVFAATALVLIIAAAIFGYDVYKYPERPQGKGALAEVIIPKGVTLTGVVAVLERAHVVTRPTLFRLYANQRGASGKIKAGRYALGSSMTPKQVLDQLIAGAHEEELQVRVPEGKNLLEVAQLLEQAGICPAEDVARAARDPKLAQELGVPGPSLEGYLFPDTYKFRPGSV